MLILKYKLDLQTLILVFRDFVFAGIGNVTEDRAVGHRDLISLEFVSDVTDESVIHIRTGKLFVAGKKNENQREREKKSENFAEEVAKQMGQ